MMIGKVGFIILGIQFGIASSNAADIKVEIKQGMTFEKARKILVKDGWQTTVMHHLGNGVPVCYDYNWNSERKEECFYEIEDCSGTGMGFCKAFYFDGDSKYLEVITAGEGNDTKVGYIHSWSKTKKEPEDVVHE